SILVNSHLIHVYSFQRDNLVIEYKSGSFVPKLEETSGNTLEFQKLTRKRGFNYREVAAAGNNTVECELNASFNNVFDSEGNQVRNVASPKHADAILFSGPISKNMEGPLNSAWEVMPSPKALIACGTEAISGGLFEKGKSPSTPDIYIAGDPPRPDVIISAFRKLMGVFSYNFQETLIKTLNELKNSFNKKN
ncbi:MAG: hydrogenase-4 subunit G, partial [Leptospiraceae bacterium]|nr:hydrogenase-4 subunit G [Leptospiraceae bacterium]